MAKLDDYHVQADQPSDRGPIVALICTICAQHGSTADGEVDVHWWDNADYVPTISDLVKEAERHEKHGHRHTDHR